jgi:hypothetical protein
VRGRSEHYCWNYCWNYCCSREHQGVAGQRVAKNTRSTRGNHVPRSDGFNVNGRQAHGSILFRESFDKGAIVARQGLRIPVPY